MHVAFACYVRMDVCTVCNMCNVCGRCDRRAYGLSVEGKGEKNTSTKEGKMNRVFATGVPFGKMVEW